jgi:hypothetical protein
VRSRSVLRSSDSTDSSLLIAMRILIATGRQSSVTFARVVRALLESLTLPARDEVVLTGPLYGSGVRFRREKNGRETFLSPILVAERGHGDCAHLSLWRVAELRNQGVAATYDVYIQERDDGRTFHVRVRLPDGSIEDPSIRLGMTKPSFEVPQ